MKPRTLIAGAAPVLVLALGAAMPAAAATAPDEVIRGTTNEVLQILDERRDDFQRDPEALHAMVREQAEAIFDTQRITRLILGRHYRGATPEQVERFTHEFREFLIRTYATAVFEIGTISIDYLPPTYSKDGKKALVKTAVSLSSTTEPVTVHYKLNVDEQERWRIYEVTVNGVSLIINYRTIYDRIIREKGLDELIANLTARNTAPAQ